MEEDQVAVVQEDVHQAVEDHHPEVEDQVPAEDKTIKQGHLPDPVSNIK